MLDVDVTKIRFYVVGKHIDDAIRIAHNLGYDCRVNSVDGIQIDVSPEFNARRVNFEIIDKTVTDVTVG